MRKIFNTELNKYRIRKGVYASDNTYGYAGAFEIPSKYAILAKLFVISSGRVKGICNGWEHVSVSLATRIPLWEEMCYIKDFFWDEEETVIQFHPPKSKYKNCHHYCLHLWKSPQNIVLPPSEMI